MATPMTATQWRTQMRKWLAPVKEYTGWETRKRPGSFSPVGVVIHHTGSDTGQNSPNYDDFLFKVGRPADGIPGPLCHSACEMDGDIILGATGRANHAGKGSSTTLNLVKKDAAPRGSEIHPGPDNTDCNAQYYGLEVKYDGGQPMTLKQYDSAVRWAAAICDFYGWSAGSVIGHRESTSRKGDPGHNPMDEFRRDVDARLKAGPGGASVPPPAPNLPPKEDDMPLTDNERQALGKAEWLANQFAANGQFTADLNKASWLAEQFAADGQLTVLLRSIQADLTQIKTKLNSTTGA